MKTSIRHNAALHKVKNSQVMGILRITRQISISTNKIFWAKNLRSML